MKPQLRAHPPSSLLDSLVDSQAEGPALELAPDYLERALYDSAREFLARPGKAFRTRLIQASYALASGHEGSAPSAAIEAIELLHGGSLIVDDIQDDATQRRGAPALHRTIGTPLALNTGNWLYFVALARLDQLALDDARARALTRAAHLCLMRCHEGQALDLALRVDVVRRAELPAIARAVSLLKTGALAGFATRLGGVVAGADERTAAALDGFGQAVGCALQMLDDLGLFVCASRHHKALEDLRGARVSWVWVWANETLDELSFKQLTRQLSKPQLPDDELILIRERLAEVAEPLGRTRIRHALAQAERALVPLAPSASAIEAVRAELENLENSYG